MPVIVDDHEVHELAAQMIAYTATVEPQAQRAVSKAIHDIVATSQQICPVDTGLLRSSIGATVSGLDAQAGPTAEYGEYVELGTSEMNPEPYMAPAFDRHAPQLEDVLGSIGERILR